MTMHQPAQTHPSTSSIPTGPWLWPRLIAHRGGGTLAPENTLAAFRTGHAQGFSMMEYDVKLSRDSVPILLHDDTICRTSNGTGSSADLAVADLLHYDFGGWHSDTYAGEAVPSLYAIAAYTIANRIHSNIEIKPNPGIETDTGTAIATIAQDLWRKAVLPPLLSSFSELALAAARAAAPELPRALLIAGEVPADWRSRVDRLDCIGVNLNHRYVTKPLVRDITSAGYSLAVWTVNNPALVQQYLDWGCHAVITDEIATINPGAYPDNPV